MDWRTPIRRGRFEIPAMPPGRRYGIVVSAPGYGQQTFSDIGAADAGRQELDIMELKPANLTLAGQVLDANDKPVAGCNVTLQGEGQPSGNTRTDREGRFVFAHVCEGSARLFANAGTSFGNVSAEGGDTNVELRLGQNFNSAPGVATHKLKGTVTDPDGKPDAGAQVAVFPTMGGRSWVKTRRQRRLQSHLAAPSLPDAVRRPGAGRSRHRPQSGGDR